LIKELELARETGPAGVADWFKLTRSPVAALPVEHMCSICELPRDGAALSIDETPKGTEVWVRNGLLSFKGAHGHGAKEQRIDVVWEGDENAPSGFPAATRPCDMHGFIKVVAGTVKFRVQLAPTLALAQEENGQLYGCSFENPRRVDDTGSPLVPAFQHCNCCFHGSCIGEWKAKGKAGSNCPLCRRDLNTPLEFPS
jgi:hypothetical protein